MQQRRAWCVMGWCLVLAACAGPNAARGGSAPARPPTSNVRLAPGMPADAIDLAAAGDILNRQTATIMRCFRERSPEGVPTVDVDLFVTLNGDGSVIEVRARGPEVFEGCARESLSPLPFPRPTVAQVTLIQVLQIRSQAEFANSSIGTALDAQLDLHQADLIACHTQAYPSAPRPEVNLTVSLVLHPDQRVTDIQVTPSSPMDECVRDVIAGFELPGRTDRMVQTLSFWVRLR